MAGARRSAARGRGARRGRKGASGWLWLFTGVLIGLGLAWYLFSKGFIPQPTPDESKAAGAQQSAAAASAEEVAPKPDQRKRSRYDFFTVLPEMEVVVPEQELSERAQPDSAQAPGAGEGHRYLLQVGSFREMSEAEQRKARLALLGVVARVQAVTVNETTWYRVRVGPVDSAREADDLRSLLADNDIDSLVMQHQ